MKLPRLYVNGKFSRLVNPINVSITQNITPLSTATVTLPAGEELPARSWVELFTPYGSAGMFRVRSPHDCYGQDTTTAELEHMISEVGDYLVKEEISEMTAANTAMQRVFKHYKGNRWKIGSVTALGSGKIALEAKYDRVLDVMLSILEQKKDVMMTFDFSTSPWTVAFAKKGTTVSAEGRMARNITSATITSDDTELCTRVWYQTFDRNHNATWTYTDASTKSKYGLIEGTVKTSADMTADEINATVNAYIDDHKEPRVSVSIQGLELSHITGESIDKMTVGKLYRLALPDYGITVEKNITSVSWSDVYGNPTAVNINLGEEEDSVVTFLHNLDSRGSGGGGSGGKAQRKEDDQWSEYIVQWEKLDDSIVGMVAKQDTQGNILEQAGLTLNSEGLLVYAKTKNGLYHQFDVLNNSFTSKINNTKKDLESEISQLDDQIKLKVSKGKVCSEINIEPGNIKIIADKIDIDGLITKLESKSIGVGSLHVEGQADFLQSIYCEAFITAEENIKANGKLIGIDGVQVGSTYTATWKSFTNRSVTLSPQRYFLYANSSGSTTPITTQTGRIVTDYTDTTIYYLGR